MDMEDRVVSISFSERKPTLKPWCCACFAVHIVKKSEDPFGIKDALSKLWKLGTNNEPSDTPKGGWLKLVCCSLKAANDHVSEN